MTAPLLQIDNLRVEVGELEPLPLVERVDFALAAGDVVGLVGETGAGKTMTMRALLGLLPRGVRGSGSIDLAERGQFDLASRESLASLRGREIGMVLQNPVGMFDPLMRLTHQLTEGVVRHKLMSKAAARTRAAELLTAMGFDDAVGTLDLYPHQLSGGMAQRAAIAMVLMPGPRVIVADEPTSALDAHIRGEVLELLRSHAKTAQAGVVIVSHDLGTVSEFCDRVIVLYRGRVVESGPSREVMSRPEHPYTRALLECAPALDAVPRQPLRVIPGGMPAPTAHQVGCVFAPRCPIAVERCREEEPPLRAQDGRAAACYFAFSAEPATAAGRSGAGAAS